MGLLANLSSAGNVLVYDLVQACKVDLLFSDADSFHTTADIHAHHTGDDLIRNGHSSANGTAHACVDIGHNANFTIRNGTLITNCLDLSGGSFLQLAGIAESSIILSYDFYHRKNSFQV